MNIIICCASGLSSGILAQKMRDEIKKLDLDYKIASINVVDLESYLEYVDIILIAPQISSQLEEINRLAEARGISSNLISRKDYANFDGKSIVMQIQGLKSKASINQTKKIAETKTAIPRLLEIVGNSSKSYFYLLIILIIGVFTHILQYLVTIQIGEAFLEPLELFSLGIFTVYFLIIFGYQFGRKLKIRTEISIVLGLVLYICLLPISIIKDYSNVSINYFTIIDIKYFGLAYLPVAMIICVSVLLLYSFLEKKVFAKFSDKIPKIFEPVFPLMVIFILIIFARSFLY